MASRMATTLRDQTLKSSITCWRLACWAILILSGALYLRVLGGQKVWDDQALISGIGIGGGESLAACFTKPFLYHYFRPLTSASFYLDHKIGGITPLFFHQTNLLIHVLTTAALIGLFQTAFRSRRVALMGALLFAIQPVQVSTVAWIGGRTDSLCTLWIALFGWGLIAAVRANGRRQLLLFGSSALAFAAAILTKEQSLALFPLVPLAFYCFKPKEEHPTLRVLTWTAMPFILVAAGCVAFWMLYYPDPLKPEIYSLRQQMGMGGRTILYYTLVLLAPDARWLHTLTLDTLNQAGSWTIVAGYTALLLYGTLLWRWLRASMAAAWFLALSLLVLLPVSNMIPLPSLTMAPYRAGVAGLGVAGLLGWGFCLLAARLRRADRPVWQNPAWVAACAYSLWCLGLTAWDAGQWRNQVVASEAFLQQDPESLFAFLNFTTGLCESGKSDAAARATETELTRLFGSRAWQNPETALRAYRRDPTIALRLRSNQGNETKPRETLADLYGRLGAMRLQTGHRQEALSAFQLGRLFYPSSCRVNFGLGLCAYDAGDLKEAAKFMWLAKASNPLASEPYFRLGIIYAREGRWAAAREQFRCAIPLRPWSGSSYLCLAEAQTNLGDYVGARATLDLALRRSVCNEAEVKRRLSRLDRVYIHRSDPTHVHAQSL